MQTPLLLLTFSLILSPAMVAAQAAPVQTAPQQTTLIAPARASDMLKPSITVVQNALMELKLDKWKKGSVREEAGGNVNSILHDIQTNLPPLMAAADAKPTSIAAAIPLMKHLDALYDVLLRVEEAARVAAPSDQINNLQLALTSMSSARFVFDDQMQRQSELDQKELTELRASVQKLQATARTTAASESKPCKPVKPEPKRRRTRRHTTKKPAAGQPAQSPQGQKKP